MRPLLRDPVEVAPVLLAHLREALAAPHLEYAEPPDPIAVGAETWIFGLEFRGAGRELRGPQVLRLFPAETDPLQSRFEQVVQNTLSDMGQPVPRVGYVCEDVSVLGGAFVIMQRMPGRMMLDSLLDGSNVLLAAPRLIIESLTRVPQTVAETQLRLHALDAGHLERALEAAGLPRRMYTVPGYIEDLANRIDSARLDGLQPGLTWLREQGPGEAEPSVICHCDLLPPNLMVDRDEVVAILDWSHTTLGEPAWDFANTRLRMAMNPVEVPVVLTPLVSPLRRRMTRVYEDMYRSRRPLDPTRVQYFEVLLSLSVLVTVGEHRASGRPESGDGRSPNLWFRPGEDAPLFTLCRQLTGLELALPA